VASADEAKKIAKDIKYPVLLKATAGGGGKGMRVCNNDEELEKGFDAVKREAASSFGYDGVLVEKFVLIHIILKCKSSLIRKGNTYHFFERECSVQRRHQKIVEEAPSPFIGEDEELRLRVCETAVKLAQAVDYDSAGTVEFIMGEDKEFYFLEMNTRIQVEHPITEEITGVDLLANMIKVALGDELDFKSQDDIKKQGHSIECRICAEDPISMLPAPGKVIGFGHTFPQGTRFDHCIYAGEEITPQFDPMIGKLITRGHNRDVAIRKMKSALDSLMIDGLKTNTSLHKVIMDEEKFKKGYYTTNYITEVKPQEQVNTEHEGSKLAEKIISMELESLL
jgi:acetyl-CoA carboxylase biotin carboxylase subunit